MAPDADDLEDAIHTALCAGNHVGGDGGKKMPGQRAQENLRRRIRQFLKELPGELTISEVREAMQ